MIAESTQVELIHDTLNYLDPDRRTITIGGAAMNVLLAAAGLEHLVERGDVDTLGPADFIADLQNRYPPDTPTEEGKYKFVARAQTWHGNRSYDVRPNNHAAGMSILSFSVTDQIRKTAPLSYEVLAANPSRTVEVDGRRFLRIGAVMRAKLMVAAGEINRHGYVGTVGRALDPAHQVGLISDAQYSELQNMLKRSPYWPPPEF